MTYDTEKVLFCSIRDVTETQFSPRVIKSSCHPLTMSTLGYFLAAADCISRLPATGGCRTLYGVCRNEGRDHIFLPQEVV